MIIGYYAAKPPRRSRKSGSLKNPEVIAATILAAAGLGTGGLRDRLSRILQSRQSWCGIATAAHVVGHADEWQQPIRIRHEGSGAPQFLNPDGRVISLDHLTDSAIVLFLKSELKLPEVPIALLPMDEPCPIGGEIGWLGYPAIEPNTLCFFAGTVSARQADRKAYLIDGVAINALRSVQVIGCVSAYHANRVAGETLPGLLRAQDVSHFHGASSMIRDIDEANLRKKEFEAAQQQKLEDAQVDEHGAAPVAGVVPEDGAGAAI